MMYRSFIVIFVLMFTLSSKAQLLNEIGIAGGGSNYSGDVGSEWFVMPNELASGVIYRRNVTPRLTIRGTYTFYNLFDDDRRSENIVRNQRGYSFSNTIHELATGVEFSYWDYDITNYRENYSPYVFFELAGFSHKAVESQNADGSYDYKTSFALAVPVGLGFKAGITRELGVSLEFRARYALTDELDYTTSEINSLNLGVSKPNTNDWYFFTGIMLTYSFQRPPCAVKARY